MCVCCGEQRGYIYVGPVFSVAELSGCICPWCIASGTAHDKFGAEFSDAAGVAGYSETQVLPTTVIAEVAFRTPGFLGWQQEHWLACCGDAAAFVGRAGHQELEHQWPGAVPSIREESGMIDDADWQSCLRALDKDGSPTAYVFQCLHCGRHFGYSDCD